MTISQDLGALMSYPKSGPQEVKLSHQDFKPVSLPPDVASSANHTCLADGVWAFLSKGIVATAYIAMASGSPCVVPSSDLMVSPPTCKSAAKR